jgi:hypothetical protein
MRDRAADAGRDPCGGPARVEVDDGVRVNHACDGRLPRGKSVDRATPRRSLSCFPTLAESAYSNRVRRKSVRRARNSDDKKRRTWPP